MKKKLIRTATVSFSLNVLLRGQLSFLNRFFDVIGIADDSDGYLKMVADREKIQTMHIGMKRNIAPFFDFLSIIRMVLVFYRMKPDIVHSITPKAGLITIIAGFLAGVPVRIHSFTGLIFPTESGIRKFILIWVDRLICMFATHIVPEGKGVKKDLIAYRITGKPLNIILNGNINGVDTAFFDRTPDVMNNSTRVRANIGLDENNFLFVFIGRINRDKGIDELVEAQRRLIELQPDSVLLIVGNIDTESIPISMETRRAFSSNLNIIFVDFQDDIRPYLALADVLVLPSYREGFPNVVLQAGSMGLPAIVTDVNGSNEIIIPGYNGMIIEPRNTDSLLKAMAEAIRMREELKIYGKNARKRVSAFFDQRDVWRETYGFYQSVLNAKQIRTKQTE
jgi:glycosyltransferase involved in cell wall biosynthesis